MKIITHLVIALAMAMSMACLATPAKAAAEDINKLACLAIIEDLQGDIAAIQISGGAKAAEKLRKDLLKILYKAESKLDKGHITETATEVVKFARKLEAAGRAGTIAPAVVAHLVGDDSIELLHCLIKLEADEDNDKD